MATTLTFNPLTGNFDCVLVATATVQAWMASPSSAKLAAAMTDETGTGALVFGTSPTFTTSIIGAAGLTIDIATANVWQQRNSTNAQTFRLYNTYTDASNYERGFVQWSGNNFQIGAEAAGTGSKRTLQLTDGVTYYLQIPPSSAPTNGMVIGANGYNTSAFNRVSIGGGAMTATSGTHVALKITETAVPTSTSTMAFYPLYIAPTINYSNATPGAGSYEALKIAVMETALPTGTNYLIRASAGAAGTTDKFSVRNTGLTTWADAADLVFGTSSGTKIGTATTQKIGFWNTTPIVQPTTAIAAATFTANAGTAVNDASTFDGYTLNQIVKALRNVGLLA